MTAPLFHERTHAALLGLAVGDALGVPVEFNARTFLKENPVTQMSGPGTHNQPQGTWSDDTSLTLCSAESLCHGDDLVDMGQRFVSWLTKAHWTPRGHVFDVGITTSEAISRLDAGKPPLEAGLRDVNNNGNGSLMRIAPIGLYFANATPELRRQKAMNTSCLTHGHPRSQIACAFYTELIAALTRGELWGVAFNNTRNLYRPWIAENHPEEVEPFSRILNPGLPTLKPAKISGSGYVIHTLEASLWATTNAKTFENAVLTAINLGLDTDTTGAVTGALAGLRFGRDKIPSRWINALARIDDLKKLCDQFALACDNANPTPRP
ncbi:MAG: ADP-ribosylglycohydrolase family protein [Algisphaera sp.]